jgi:hypothetical protein
MSDDIYGFNGQDADALLRLIGDKSKGYGHTVHSREVYMGVAVGEIPAFNAGVCGVGTAMLKYIDDVGAFHNMWSVEVFNPSTLVASGSLMYVFRIGNRFTVAEVCG